MGRLIDFSGDARFPGRRRRANGDGGEIVASSQARGARRRWAGLIGAGALLVSPASAFAFQPLPPGGQVNDDLAAGINKTISVNGGEPTNSDVVGGALTAGKPAVPWTVFRQQETNGTPPPHDQIFSRSFAAGAWTTRGAGTVGGISSAHPQFRGSLNFNQAIDGEAPSIDFTGTGRTVPWATWYENTKGTGFGNNNVFASRFDNTGDANQNKWIFGGQSRGVAGTTGVRVPSLNIHTNQNAENPAIAGGSAVDPTKPGPWVSWQETTTRPVAGMDQIFVSRPIGPASVNCDGVKPAGVPVAGHVPAIGGFCFQQVGIPRVGPGTADPSLNVDPTRNGIEPDIAFTGPNDSVPWVVWYETGNTLLSGLNNNEMVFAAKGVSDGVGANGGFHWVAVGNALQGTLDLTGPNKFGNCAASAANEAKCTISRDPTADSENPQVAAGTMNPANPTVPWVTWDEFIGGVHKIFVSRLVGTGTTAHFQLVNNGGSISVANDATRPDITFSGNTPYVSWRQLVGGVEEGLIGHFVNPTNPTFVLDINNVPLTPTAQADVREPISSACTANPFNSDGAACQGGAVGTPFFLFTNGTAPRSLFAGAYLATNVVTGAATGITASSATLNGSVIPHGASVKVSFDFGTTTAYGSTTTPQKTGPDHTSDPFSAVLTGLPSGTKFHYRAVATSDFGRVVGADHVFTTQ